MCVEIECSKNPTSLNMEVKIFAEGLPYWAKFLAEKILSKNVISKIDMDNSFSYLLEELLLNKETDKSEITISSDIKKQNEYKTNLLFTKLENVEGVNALIEKQEIEFSPNMTIIYGENGSGKSGYVRLLKKVFNSRSPENILQNIHILNGHKPINAQFIFKSDGTNIILTYTDKDKQEFDQFSVFDGKSVITHLEQKNEFEFRPSGLSFFADFTDAISQIEDLLDTAVREKRTLTAQIDLADLFEGYSEIKSIIENLNAQTNIEDIKEKYTPFSVEDRNKLKEIQIQYDDLLLVSKGKEKEIQKLDEINLLLKKSKQDIEKINSFFSKEHLQENKKLIDDCIVKLDMAKTEGIECFNTDNIIGIGNIEWKEFILAASEFAKKQKPDELNYPQKGDYCILCQQPLSEDAEKLITKYWIFIKSEAEQNVKQAQILLDNEVNKYELLNFNLFPEENILAAWLKEKYPSEFETLQRELLDKKALSDIIISNIRNKVADNLNELSINVNQFEIIEADNNAYIKTLRNDEQNIKLDELLKSKTFLEHKEKLNIHISKIEDYINNQNWIEKAKTAGFPILKRKTTEAEKSLSETYFNQQYIDSFNEECQKLNGNFGIEIKHTGSAGKSYRQLKLKGENPNAILSEGEQKIIALADFLAEMNLSEINRGIIFDDPVNSLDDKRKSEIAIRLAEEASTKQTIIFTHDLVFISNLLVKCEENGTSVSCHWIENQNNHPGQIWLNNAPSYEQKYRNSNSVKEYYNECKDEKCPPEKRGELLKQGFGALRTCYEVLVIHDLFNDVVQRYNERVSIDALSKVVFDEKLIDEILDNFSQCCRYIEGHSHSDKYAYKKPDLQSLNEEIEQYELIKKKIKDNKKAKLNK
jgi:energy-coupling factor transporter ATP-binding protein EcfA2